MWLCNYSRAEEKKKLGNEQYKQHKYVSAINLYTEAITLYGKSPSYYGNRSACYMMIGDYRRALDNALKSTKIDDEFTKGYVRAVKCFIKLDDYDGALKLTNAKCPIKHFKDEVKYFCKFKKLENQIFSSDKTDKKLCTLSKMEELLRVIFSPKTKHFTNDFGAIYIRLFDIAKSEKFADLLFLEALTSYFLNDLETCLAQSKKFIGRDPDNVKAKQLHQNSKKYISLKAQGNQLFKSGAFEKASEIYSSALKIDNENKLVNSTFHYNLALISSKLGLHADSIESCSRALELNPKYTKALLLRGKCYGILELFLKSVNDYENACLLENNKSINQLLLNAKLSLGRYHSNQIDEAESLFESGKTEEASKIAETIIREDPFSVPALYIYGLCSFFESDAKDYDMFSKRALQLIGGNHSKANFYRKKTLLMRANCHKSKGKHEECIQDLELAYDISADEDILKTISEVVKEFMYKPGPEILGISSDADIKEVKKAYHAKAKKHHPDRHSNSVSKIRTFHGEIFKRVKFVYDAISNKLKRDK